MARLSSISKFWYPLIKARVPSRLSLAALREAMAISLSPKQSLEAPAAAQRSGTPTRSRLSTEKREQMLADLRKGYEALEADPEALADDIGEGRFLDEALNDPIDDEE